MVKRNVKRLGQRQLQKIMIVLSQRASILSLLDGIIYAEDDFLDGLGLRGDTSSGVVRLHEDIRRILVEASDKIYKRIYR